MNEVPPLPPTCQTDEPWQDPWEYETVREGLPVLPIFVGVIGICCGVLAILLLLTWL